jgi:hypothetical protein
MEKAAAEPRPLKYLIAATLDRYQFVRREA